MRILLVEDEIELAQSICILLRNAGYAVDHVETSARTLHALQVEHFDLLILDLGLPDADGIDVVRALRQRNADLPVLIITARDALDSRVAGLDVGADGYMVKPVAFEELVARVRSLIRRHRSDGMTVFQIGELEFDTLKKCARHDARELALTPREWSALEYLALHAGTVLSKEQLLQSLSNWSNPITPNAVEALVSRLRSKLEGTGIQIQTIRGFGYLLTETTPIH